MITLNDIKREISLVKLGISNTPEYIDVIINHLNTHLNSLNLYISSTPKNMRYIGKTEEAIIMAYSMSDYNNLHIDYRQILEPLYKIVSPETAYDLILWWINSNLDSPQFKNLFSYDSLSEAFKIPSLILKENNYFNAQPLGNNI